MPGAVNHDIVVHAPWVDVAHDLNVYPWPWPDNTFGAIAALDVLEHLQSFLGFFDECWRILLPGGRLGLRTPRFDSINAVIDPTHVRCYHPQSFDYLDPGTTWGEKYSMYTPHKWSKVDLIDGDNIWVVMEVVKDA